ncbi:heparin binding hemagglutinin HbhA [Amycolatopsis cihanbeyliensis]|uniref:Heparin binding hemagglutinin HbhA n=2 Tax=Amycolatopsis cihanbeyliensis TaxID=1128664 RepID=A0A542DJW0_AMYCI|nr:hypothetical protein [Amycolatopsis cihanbeyliensis]TQJ03388.1 heparin binding hemagglutinin HbhA [Amycolatopsis cihanbeyliensis]
MATAKDGKTTKTTEQTGVNAALEQVRTPLLAALGAGNLASQAVVDAVGKARERVTEGSESARKTFEDLPNEVESLRGKLDPAELRKLIDEYTDAAVKLYNKLTESGEQAWDKIAAQPQVKRAIEQLEEALNTAGDRVEDVAGETRERVDEVLARVTKRTRSSGEQAARTVQEVAGEVAERIEDAGEDLAHETRSATRKAANKTAKATSTPRGGSTSSSTTKKSTNGSSGSKSS